MSTIAVLDQNTIDKIAAGEVVDRPASVVKELVENAIDAGASAVTVEIRDGGISFLRITDNGRGIEKNQVPLAFLRHATSKIQKVEDLTSLSSLGFRGEALSSIAAVSQVELVTKTADQITGARYIIEGGVEKSLEEIGAPNGTTFLVRNLFYNTPARAKFLKTPATEGGYISSYLEQLALSNPDVSFTFKANNSIRLTTSGNGNLKDAIYAIYGRDISRELEEIEYEENGLKIWGYTAKPVVSRGNRNYENYYVNGRYIKSKILAKAIEDAYKPFMMQHKYPFTAFQIQMDGSVVDVNVHPTKMEVRFSDQEFIYRAVFAAITEALRQKELIPKVSVSKEEKPAARQTVSRPVPEPFETKRREFLREDAAPYMVNGTGAAPVVEPAQAHKMIPQGTHDPVAARIHEPKSDTIQQPLSGPIPDSMPNVPEKPVQEELFAPNLLTEEARKQHRLIGQVFETYWLVEFDEKLFIIDQHAAHEKVLYERTMKDYKTKQITSQMLCPPLIVSLNLEEETTLKTHMDVFLELGFEVEGFGGREYNIRAVPHNLYGLNSKDLFVELLDSISQESTGQPLDMITAKVAFMSCKAAVKGNHIMSAREADALIDELLTLDNPYHCPHGRPTIISMSKYEMEKKFKRIV
ncbi:MAG: DNA mismatch repair endonuclease MutL [Lachnospiraceae bacterium]|nr:DNA mismatch repair endonuclease MutL [Lachnospiraceae bacterium]